MKAKKSNLLPDSCADMRNSTQRMQWLIPNGFPNINADYISEIANAISLTYVPEKEDELNVCFATSAELRPEFRDTFSSSDISDYTYAIAHSTKYQDEDKEQFTHVHIPKNAIIFWQLVKLGNELRQIHEIEISCLDDITILFPDVGDNIVTKAFFVHGTHNPNEVATQKLLKSNIDYQRPHFIVRDVKIYHNTITTLPYNPKLKKRVKELRYAKNLPEVLFWLQVHKNHFHNIDFDRQRIIGNYIVDFYVKKLGLVVEIDSSNDDTTEKQNTQQDDYLRSLGLRIFRIPATDVLQNMQKTLSGLERFIIDNYSEVQEPKQPPRPTGTPPAEGKTQSVGRVYINETQYFDNIPKIAWELNFRDCHFAKRWLEDREGCKLNDSDILSFREIIMALSETSKIIKDIDLLL